MTKYHIGADNITGTEMQDCNDIAAELQSCGHETKVYPVGPNKEGLAQEIGGGKDDILVFLVGGVAGCTLWSIKECVKNGSCCKTIFAYAGWTSTDPSSPMHSKDANFNYKIGAEHDSGQYLNDSSRSACETDIGGRTQKEYVDANSQYIGICYSDQNAKDLGKQICSGTCGQGGSSPTNTSSQGGIGGVNIVDKTFYGLIKQMIGAVDALFIISNNMAYLISFKQFYDYRNKYDEFIPQLEKKDILPDVEKWWSTDGFYNAVEVTYDGGAVKYKNDALVNQYGENVWYYDFPKDDEDTAKAKADALLSAHVRDYAQDVRMTIVYNPNINVGSWIKVPKEVTNMSGVPTEKGETQEEKKEKIINGVTIENIVEVVQELEDGVTKYLEHRTDDEGKEYDIEFEKSDYELFFVQGYSIRWTSDKAPLMDLHLKYGPDTPEDPINATIAGGEGGTTAASGQWGNDAFRIDDICVANNEKIMGAYSGGSNVQQVKELVNTKYKPEPEDYQPRANKNSNYAKKYGALGSPAAVFQAFRSEYKYSMYADNSPCWKSATDFYDNAGKTANCGDTTCLLKVFFDCIGVPSCGVHIDQHYFNAIQINGTWEIIDGVRIDNQTVNFPDGSGYSFGNPCPCNSYNSSGGNNNQNSGGNN